MSSDATGLRRWRNWLLPLVVLVLLAGSLGVFWYASAEALEERGVASAADQLRVADLTIDSFENLLAAGQTPELADLQAAVVVLTADHSEALHALSTADAERAGELLALHSDRARVLLETTLGGNAVPPRAVSTDAGRGELRVLLERAAEEASTAATQAERNVRLAFGVALSVLAVSGLLVSRARSRALRDRAEASSLINTGQRLEALLNDAPELIMVVDESEQVVYQSASVPRLFGEPLGSLDDLLDRVLGASQRRVRDHVMGQGLDGAVEITRIRDLDDNSLSFELRVSDLSGHELVGGHLVTGRDVTRELQLQDELRRQASLDVLTGLPNRRALAPAIKAARSQIEDEGGLLALLMLDLDGFKDTNDTLGHAAGDELLRAVAERLGSVLHDGETLLRLGGDEFAVVLAAAAGAPQVGTTCERLLAALDQPFQVGHRLEALRTSIGAVVSDGAEPGTLLRQADIALYEAKGAGGGAAVFFEPEMELEAAAISAMSRALRDADFNDQFRLEFQPIVESDTRRIVAAEALLRWTSPTLGSVPPGKFVPVAEQSGQIGRIGHWVMKEVCHQVARWDRQGLGSDFRISFNVSPLQLEDDEFVEALFSTITEVGIAAERLTVEVTETTLLDLDDALINRLERLRRAGLSISMDDFGSGYSNLGQLIGLPLDVIKIDRSLLLTLTAMREQSGGDPDEPCAIMSAIVSIAGVLDVPVVAEGVETDLQRRSLRSSGVSHLQGYLLGGPAAPEVLAARLTEQAAKQLTSIG